MPVLRTANVQHTKDLVVYLAKQLVAGELQHKPVVAEPVKKRHTRDLDGATLFTHLISNVPGMSAAKATAVSKSFGCFADLAAASETDLANVMVEPTDASGKKKARRLGPAVAARLKTLWARWHGARASGMLGGARRRRGVNVKSTGTRTKKGSEEWW